MKLKFLGAAGTVTGSRYLLVELRTSGAKGPQHATFYFRHPSFARPKAKPPQ